MSIPEITHIVSLLEKGQTGEARPLLETLIHEVPNHVSARVIMARLLEAQKDEAGALLQWKKAAYLSPDNPVIEKGLRKAVMRNLFSGHPGALAETPPQMAPPSQVDEAKGLPDMADEAVLGAEGPAIPAPEMEPEKLGMTQAHVQQEAGSPELSPEAPPEPVQQPEPVQAQEPAMAEPEKTEHDVVPEFQDLDRLIHELETARIVPDPDIKMIPQGELETEIDDVVSETLARIYANQKFFEEAAAVYDKLAIQRPEKASEFARKADEMRQKVAGKA
jgi:tetratricopeptide (TPR) repeat protein